MGLFISGIQLPDQFIFIKSTIPEDIYKTKLQNQLFVILYFVILLILISRKEYYSFFNLSPLKKKSTYVWMVGLLALVLFIQHHPFSLYFLPISAFEYIQLLIITSILVPIYEELLFRGVLILVPPEKLRYPMLIMSSVLFASLHSNFLDAFILGVALSILAIRFRNLLVPMVAHSLWNLFATFY
ncbi:lysostaphin resistance A-like protein [Bacillus sp. SCS-153A]|uniref:CPBP family intramembrane glutamic endopeptidase n=1 Tax=Rossellomorea sedimentorum TaxID=3115294 RepID=UPI003906C3DD